MTNLTAMETALLFGVSREAVRKYSLEFDAFLSPVARPQKGRQRMFTPDDLEVISLVVMLKAEGKLFADIHAALGAGQRAEPPQPTSAITTPNTPQLALTARVTELESALERERGLRHEAEGQVKLLERLLREAQERLFRREW